MKATTVKGVADKEFLSFYAHGKDGNVPDGAGDGHICQFPVEPARLHTPANMHTLNFVIAQHALSVAGEMYLEI